MFGKKAKPAVNVEEAVATVMKFVEQDEMFGSILKGIMGGNAVQIQAIVKALPGELTRKGASPELIAAAETLQNFDVLKKVRELILKK